MSPSSQNIFKLLLKFKVYAGRFSNSSKRKLLTYSYLFGLFVVFFSQIVCQIFVLAFKFYLNDGSDVVCLMAMFFENCIIILWHFRRGSRSEENYRRTTEVVDRILDLSAHSEGVSAVMKYTRFVNSLIVLYAINVSTLQILQLLIKSLSFLKVTDLVPDYFLWIYTMPWPVTVYTYWPTLALQAFSTLFMIIIQQVNLYFIMAMMILQTLGFQHLKISLADIIGSTKVTKIDARFTSSTIELLGYKREFEQRERLKVWVKLHSELINLCKEFVEIYTPMFISYYLVMFVILLAAVFALLQNFKFFGVAEAVLLSLYFSGVILNLFVLSLTGSYLTIESGKVFEKAFQSSWYDCSAGVKSSLGVVVTVARRPVVVTPLGSEHFAMSLHTFIWIMKTMGSFYMGLAEIKRRSVVGE